MKLPNPSPIEKNIIKHHSQKSQRAFVNPQKFYNIYHHFFSHYDFKNKNVIDLGPSQCHFLRIARKLGATVYVLDSEPCVIKLGKHYSISIEGFNYVVNDIEKSSLVGNMKMDCIFCRGSFDLADRNLETLCKNLQKLMKEDSIGFLYAWINPKAKPVDIKKGAWMFKKYGWNVYLFRWPKPIYGPRFIKNYIFLKNLKPNKYLKKVL